MNGINKAILVGNAGLGAEVRIGQNGGTAARFTLATTETWKDAKGARQERTEWHKIKLFGPLAEFAGQYVTKGALVYVEGAFRTSKYTDKEGVERFSTEVVANKLELLGSKPAAQATNDAAPQRAAA